MTETEFIMYTSKRSFNQISERIFIISFFINARLVDFSAHASWVIFERLYVDSHEAYSRKSSQSREAEERCVRRTLRRRT